jgi:hypothetical protein
MSAVLWTWQSNKIVFELNTVSASHPNLLAAFVVFTDAT